jgi:transposase
VIYLKEKEDKLYVGFDIHEKGFVGTIMDLHGKIIAAGTVQYSKEGVQNFLGCFSSSKIKIAIEACCLWRGVFNLLTELGYDVVLADPLQTHRIAGKKKTDKVDSKTLADLLRTGYLPKVYIPSEEIIKLRDIARHRTRLVRLRVKLQLMIKSYMSRDGTKFPGNWNKDTYSKLKKINKMIKNFVEIIEVIDEQIKHVTGDIKHIASNKYSTQLLQTMPGIGEISSLMIAGEIGDIKRFNNPKSLVSYAGLCPGVYQSGEISHDVINNANNKYLKWILTECSGRASALDSRYMKHYARVKKRKGFKVARRSLARKMITDIWHMLTKEEPFRKSGS